MSRRASARIGYRARPDWLGDYDAYLEGLVRDAAVPGAAVCVTLGNDVVYQRGFGWRDREARLPVTPRTVFGLASLSKSFTALTALVLQARGTWSLEDEVRDHLPEFDYPGLADGQPVRLWHMLSHTTGVPPLRALQFALRRDQRGDAASTYAEEDPSSDPDVGGYDQLMAYLRRGERGLLGPPGSICSYSNECVALVGAAIERVTGRSFSDVLQGEVLRPLGMTSTTFDPIAARATGDHAVLYTRTPAGVVRSPVWSLAPAYLGTGMLKSSISDLTRYLRFLAVGEGELLGLTPKHLAELTAPRVWSQPGGHYALGWSVRERGGMKVVRHGGSLKGVSASQGFVPELGLGVAVLMNLDGAPALRAWQGAVNLALGDAPETPLFGGGHEALRAGPDEPRALLERLAGTYSSGEPWGRMELRVEPFSQEEDGDVNLVAYTGDDRERVGKVALLEPAERGGTAEFVLVGDAGAWDGGRFHLGPDGTPFAVQQGQRWYDAERPAGLREET